MVYPERPQGSKVLSARCLKKGKEYTLDKLYQDVNSFNNSKECMKTVAVFKQFGINFITYLPFEFDNKSKEYIDGLNAEIKANKRVRMVYYGSIGNQLIVDILKDGEEVDIEKLEGIASLNEAEQEETPPKKRSSSDGLEEASTSQSGSKKPAV